MRAFGGTERRQSFAMHQENKAKFEGSFPKFDNNPKNVHDITSKEL